jgi:hypothetical protein
VEFFRLGGCEIWVGFGKDELTAIHNLLYFSELKNQCGRRAKIRHVEYWIAEK